MEVWKPIPSLPGYEASSLGRVRSVDRDYTDSRGRKYRHVGRVLSQTLSTNGYLRFRTPSGTRSTHVVVLEAFAGARPAGHQAAHRDGNRTNNRSDNLRWATPRENAADKQAHGTTFRPQGERHPAATLTEAQVVRLLERYAAGERQIDIARDTGVDKRKLNAIVKGRSWPHVRPDLRALGRVG